MLGIHVDIHIQFMFNLYDIVNLERNMMKRTNVVLDEQLIEAGLEATGLKSRRALIDHALRELLRMESQKKILGLKGAVKWEGDLRLSPAF